MTPSRPPMFLHDMTASERRKYGVTGSGGVLECSGTGWQRLREALPSLMIGAITDLSVSGCTEKQEQGQFRYTLHAPSQS